jgi:hypothetical protein
LGSTKNNLEQSKQKNTIMKEHEQPQYEPKPIPTKDRKPKNNPSDHTPRETLTT